ncbi:MAG: hypothetical protein KGN74_08985, partial [Gemmatimonadota bacterium]|nr:hypothetical protein [Gemmatimonadota bacterium]
TAAVPATRVAGAADLAPAKPAPAATPSGKSKMPLVAAVVTVVVLGGGTALVMQMKKPAAPANAPAPVTQGAADSSGAMQGKGVVQTPAGAPGANAQPKGTEELRKQEAKQPPVTTAGNTKAPAVENPGAGPSGQVNVDAVLTRLENTVDANTFNKAMASGVLQALDSLSGRLSSTIQQVRAAIARSSSESTLGNTDVACQILRQIKDKALTTSYANQVNTMLGQCN